MRHELLHPQLDIPDKEDPAFWASIVGIRAEWFRSIAPQLEMNVEKLVLGYVLTTIIGDDQNVFFIANTPDIFQPDYANQSKEDLFIRLQWEIMTPKIPNKLRLKIKQITQELNTLDWTKFEQFLVAKDIWQKFRGEVEKEIQKNKILSNAYLYYLQMNDELSAPWWEFLSMK